MQIAPEINMILSLLIPLFLLMFGGFLVGYSSITFGDASSFGAGFMPTIIGYLIITFALLDLVISWKKRSTIISDSSAMGNFISVLMVSGFILFYIFAVDYLGFTITASLIISVMFLMFLEKYRLLAVIGAIALSLGIYLFFSRVLLVPLPAGSLF